MKHVILIALLVASNFVTAQLRSVDDRKPVVIPPKNEIPKFPKDVRRDFPPYTRSEVDKFNFNGDEIWLYSDINYKGDKKIIKINTKYTLKDLGIEWNDRISSILIPVKKNGYFQFFRDDNIQGGYLQLQNIGKEANFPNAGQYPDLTKIKLDKLTNVYMDTKWMGYTEGSYNDIISSISFLTI